MDIAFVAGFGPIGTTGSTSHDFWAGTLGIGFDQPAAGYFHTEALDGVRAFAIWPLTQAAESVFGTQNWPDDLPVPQAWIEFDLATPDAVQAAADELTAGGHRLLREVVLEPWGQWTARLLSPEGLLVGITYTPWMHA
jgi:hypothetical protein